MRDKGLDLIKIIAILTMVIDHLRFIFPHYQSYLMTIGRWAFPLFAYLIAINTFRALENSNLKSLKSYATNLFLFALISEVPYRLMVGTSQVFNVMPTLLIGFLSILLINLTKSTKNPFIFLGAVGLFLPIQHYFEYGILGVFLIISFYSYISMTGSIKNIFFVLAVIFALLCNLQYFYPIITKLGLFSIYTNNLIVSIFLVMLLIYLITNFSLVKFNVPKVGKWAYWFYPIHMLIVFLIAKVIT